MNVVLHSTNDTNDESQYWLYSESLIAEMNFKPKKTWISTHPLKTVGRLRIHICYKKIQCKWQAVLKDKGEKKNNYAQMKLYQQTSYDHYNNNNKGVINHAHKVKLTLMWELKCTHSYILNFHKLRSMESRTFIINFDQVHTFQLWEVR